MSFDAGGDVCLGFWALHWDKGHIPTFPKGARVLEVGCAEADWMTPMWQVQPDLDLVGIDVRPCEQQEVDGVRTRRGTIQGDVLTYPLEPQSFDAIVAISSIEHVGLGAYGDPSHENGDTVAMKRCAEWVKPKGWMYLDVPFSEDLNGYAVNGNYRRYTWTALHGRILRDVWRVRWAEVMTPSHPDAPYVSLLLERK